MREDETVVFCPGECPLAPEGARVAVEHVRLDATGQAARVVCRVVGSVDPQFEIDDESVIVVNAQGKSPEEIKQGIATCQEPKKGRLLTRALGGRGVCQGVEFIRSDRA